MVRAHPPRPLVGCNTPKGGAGYNGPVPTYPGGSSTGHTYGVKYWEIGNEVYGDGTYGANWEYDNNNHSPATYASNVVAYSKAMKAVDPTVLIGAVLTAPGSWPDGVTNSASPQPWNQTVLSTACSSIDLAIVHWYAQNPGSESDASLLSDTSQIASMVSSVRSELTQYCGSHSMAIQRKLARQSPHMERTATPLPPRLVHPPA